MIMLPTSDVQYLLVYWKWIQAFQQIRTKFDGNQLYKLYVLSENFKLNNYRLTSRCLNIQLGYIHLGVYTNILSFGLVWILTAFYLPIKSIIYNQWNFCWQSDAEETCETGEVV